MYVKKVKYQLNVFSKKDSKIRFSHDFNDFALV